MTNDRKQLNLFQPIVVMIGLGIVSAVVLSLFASASKQRQVAVRNTYTAETKLFMERNREGLRTIFLEVMDRDYCRNRSEPECEISKRDRIGMLIDDELKDFSSSLFVRLEDDGQVMTMKLSGDREAYSPWPPGKKDLVTNLLRGEVKELPWDEYYHGFPGKDVIVPFEDEDGQVLGALIRGVIEK